MQVRKQESGIVASTTSNRIYCDMLMHPAIKEQVISIVYAGLYLLHFSMGSIRVND